jgi:hypothetical protein
VSYDSVGWLGSYSAGLALCTLLSAAPSANYSVLAGAWTQLEQWLSLSLSLSPKSLFFFFVLRLELRAS